MGIIPVVPGKAGARSANPVSPRAELAAGGDRLALPTLLQVERANAGDHALIYEMLLSAGCAPSRKEYVASLEDPFYQPADRLLIKKHGLPIAQLQLTRRVLLFGGVELPASQIQQSAILPEFRGQALAEGLLREADYQMRRDGALLGHVRTGDPDFYAQRDWVSLGRPRYLEAGAPQIRAALASQDKVFDDPARRITTRLWRQVELRQLMRLYSRAARGSFGRWQRCEELWRWLVSRGAYDAIVVAIEGEDNLEYGEQAPPMVGYAVCRGDHVVEVVTGPDDPAVLGQLMSRVCREAIERDNLGLRIAVGDNVRLVRLIEQAGGRACPGPGVSGQVSLVKMLDPIALLAELFPLLHERSRSGGLVRPLEMHFAIDGASYRFSLSQRSIKITPAPPSRFDVQASLPALSRLCLGLAPVDELLRTECGLAVRNKSIQQTLEILFPPVCWVQGGLDQLPA